MSDNDSTTAFAQSPDAVFAAINNVRAWRSGEIDGVTDQLGAEFTYRYKDVHLSTQSIMEMVSGPRVIWRVIDAEINFVKDTGEWNGTSVGFDITPRGEKSCGSCTRTWSLTIECYGGCSGAWGFVGESLRSLITTGTGFAQCRRLAGQPDGASLAARFQRPCSTPAQR